MTDQFADFAHADPNDLAERPAASRRIEGWLASHAAPPDRLLLFDGDRLNSFGMDSTVCAAAATMRKNSAVALEVIGEGDETRVTGIELIAAASAEGTGQRYLEMRNPEFRRRIDLRHDLWLGLSTLLAERGFRHVETPLLATPSASGAREYHTQPSRSGRDYALPQSPQLFGHLLALGGIKRYFQWGRCFRDEDPRSNRQPEFTQLHIEMAFVDRTMVMALIEDVVARAFAIAGRPNVRPAHLSYDDAVSRFGTDKPDLRLAPEFCVLPFRIEGDDAALAMAELPCGLTIDEALYAELTGEANKRHYRLIGSGRRAALRKASLPPLVSEEELTRAFALGRGGKGHDCLVFVGEWRRHRRLSRVIYAALSERPARPDGDSLLWVTSFPLFEEDPEQKGRLLSAAHPFLLPEDSDAVLRATRNSELLAQRGQAMDLVLNGEEIGSGSMLISDRALQMRVFHALGLSRADIRRGYGAIMDAMQFGAPPIGGFGLGFDRLVASLTGCEHIRDVIAFPKTKTGSCMVFGELEQRGR